MGFQIWKVLLVLWIALEIEDAYMLLQSLTLKPQMNDKNVTDESNLRYECGHLLMTVFGRERLRRDAALLEFVEELQSGTCPSERCASTLWNFKCRTRLRYELDELSRVLYRRIEALQRSSPRSMNSTSPHTPRSDGSVRGEQRMGLLKKAADCFGESAGRLRRRIQWRMKKDRLLLEIIRYDRRIVLARKFFAVVVSLTRELWFTLNLRALCW